MGIFARKTNRKIDAHALAYADDLFSYVQPDIAREHFLGGGKLSKKKAAKVKQKFIDIEQQMKRFAESNELGIYGRARLQKKFNERLEALGYDIELINTITEKLLFQR